MSIQQMIRLIIEPFFIFSTTNPNRHPFIKKMEEKQRKVPTLTGSNDRKAEKILNYLVSTPEGATPKMIAAATRINVNTVKTLLPQLKNIKRFTRGWYKVVNRGDAPPLLSWTFHNLIMSCQLPNKRRPSHDKTFNLGLIKAHVIISNNGKATCRVSCDYPLNVSSVCMVYAFFSQHIYVIAGFLPSLSETVINTIEFNKDYQHLRLDGVKAITLDNLVTHFKLYQKEHALRKEYKTKRPFTANNLIDMLTQHPNDLELATRLEEHKKQLEKLTGMANRNNQLMMALLKKQDR